MIKQPKFLFLEIQLVHAHIPVWRIVEVQHTMTLHELHACIQVAMGWESHHLYEFEISGQRYEMPYTPPMSVVGEDEGLNTHNTKLRELGLKVGDTFTYLYDFGDSWLHEITVKSYSGRPQSTFDTLPICRAGAMACPPEDIGGIPVYNALVQFRLHRTPIDIYPDLQKIFKDFDPYQANIESPYLFAKAVKWRVKRMEES